MEELTEGKKKGLTAFTLKMIAIITMLIDHTAAVIIERGYIVGHYKEAIANNDMMGLILSDNVTVTYGIMRLIGRLAFPIFCFFIVEGFYHTRNVWKYLGRLVIFAFISEVPFDMAFFGEPFHIGYQNVYFTLALGLLSIILYDKFKEKKKVLGILCFIVLAILSFVLRTDYMAIGVVFIFTFYMLREKVKVRNILLSVEFFLCSYTEIAAIISLVLIHFYNGEKGKSLKYVFYAFYPVHLLILVLLYELMY